MHRMFLKAVKAFFFFMTVEVNNLDIVTVTLYKKKNNSKSINLAVLVGSVDG